MTVAVLVWKVGIFCWDCHAEQRRLEEQVYRIRQQGQVIPFEMGLPVTFLRLTLWQSLIVKMQ